MAAPICSPHRPVQGLPTAPDIEKPVESSSAAVAKAIFNLAGKRRREPESYSRADSCSAQGSGKELTENIATPPAAKRQDFKNVVATSKEDKRCDTEKPVEEQLEVIAPAPLKLDAKQGDTKVVQKDPDGKEVDRSIPVVGQIVAIATVALKLDAGTSGPGSVALNQQERITVRRILERLEASKKEHSRLAEEGTDELGLLIEGFS